MMGKPCYQREHFLLMKTMSCLENTEISNDLESSWGEVKLESKMKLPSLTLIPLGGNSYNNNDNDTHGTYHVSHWTFCICLNIIILTNFTFYVVVSLLC